MLRAFCCAAALSIASSATAGIGGHIAYSVGRDLYLINQDGSGKRQLYRGAVGTSIFGISMGKDGGQLSFEEVASNGQSARLLTLGYGASGAATVLRSVPGCRFALDTREDGAILAVDSCNGVLKFSSSPGAPLDPVGTAGRVSKVSWMGDGSFLYASAGRIYYANLLNPNGTAIRTQDCIQDLAGANVASEALYSVGQVCGGPRIDRMNVPAGTASQIASGPDASYSQDDRCFIFISPVRNRGAYLLIAPINGGSSVPLGNAADYKAVDWRGDSVPAPCPIASAPLMIRPIR